MSFLNQMKEVLEMEANAITRVVQFLDEENCERLMGLYERLTKTGGQLIFCGVGKSGLVGEKLSSTFASLGLRSIFLHPTEALHGDLGRASERDGMVFLSKSGSTAEIVKLIPFLPMKSENLVALVGDTTKDIANHCSIVFDCSVEKEACINNLAPTTSSTVALAMGDAMAVAYESYVGLSKEGYAKYHPGGMLGKSLLMKVRDLMWTADKCPTLTKDQTLKDVVFEMTKHPVGACAITDDKGSLLGIVVEGDIRRSIAKSDQALSESVANIMTSSPISIEADKLALDALNLMENKDRQIYVLPVLEGKKFVGFIRMHDLLKEGFSK
ncbi:SIS domain-containing protein [Bacteriovorax sp. DB6_IX]|uniref:KpsF/GutQ family sugar-phosphate isomerase n=1 Tax=Bacteriovorax sp. DB6_IX TaxID=1353530 RepID=UPI000389F79F|nr:KpsF/GutQ family sugar-phosphate isomerase [Bacteriovorax sp. DB6_IX]EQC52394.1 sugar isomerase, KpsF/GutQ family [Bacteriovorax sp. DB6_IX]